MWEYKVGHVIDVLRTLDAESIQCVVTSPPYWGLRRYAGEQDILWGGDAGCHHEWGQELKVSRPSNPDTGLANTGTGAPSTRLLGLQQAGERSQSGGRFCHLCGAWKGGYGLEPTIELYVQHTVEILREIRRVLRKDGVVFWNIGDSYAGSGKGQNGNGVPGDAGEKQTTNRGTMTGGLPTEYPGLKPKDLCLIPFRVALAVQADGWWCRSDIIWSKLNPMPESCTDRPTKSHEYIFLFTKSKDYYWDQEAVREKLMAPPHAPRNKKLDKSRNDHDQMEKVWGSASGRNIRSVWSIATQPYSEAHFATFPEEIPKRCIKAGTKKGDTVLDPFCGSGTTLRVARDLGRNAIGIDICNNYKELAEKRADLNIPDITKFGVDV